MYKAWPKKGPHGVKGQGHPGVKVILKNLYISETLGPISSKLGTCVRLGERSDPTGSKVKVTGVRVMLKNLQYLEDPWPDLNQTWCMY